METIHTSHTAPFNPFLLFSFAVLTLGCSDANDVGGPPDHWAASGGSGDGDDSSPAEEDWAPCDPYPHVREGNIEMDVLLEPATRGQWSHQVRHHEENLFWFELDVYSDAGTTRLKRAPEDMSAPPVVVIEWDDAPDQDLFFDGDRIFYKNSEAIWALNWRTGTEELVYDEPGFCEISPFTSVTQNERSLFFAIGGSPILCGEEPGILSIDKQTFAISRVEGDFRRPFAPATFGNYLYYADGPEYEDEWATDEITRIDLETGEHQYIGTIELNLFFRLVPFDGGVAYMVRIDDGTREIWHLSDEGDHRPILTGTCESPRALWTYGDKLYFNDVGMYVLSPGQNSMMHYPIYHADALNPWAPALAGGFAYYFSRDGSLIRAAMFD